MGEMISFDMYAYILLWIVIFLIIARSVNVIGGKLNDIIYNV